MPVGTRKIRIQMTFRRITFSGFSGYIDDISATLISDGSAAVHPFLTVINGDAKSGTTGWTSELGGMAVQTTAPCQQYSCFYGGSFAESRSYQDIALPADRHSEIDADRRALTVTWQQGSFSSFEVDEAGMEIEFLDGSSTPIGTVAASTVETVTTWAAKSLTADIPSGARTARLRIRIVRKLGISNDAYVTSIRARLTGHSAAVLPVNMLASVDGPRTDVTDTTTYDYTDYGFVKSVTNALSQVTQITSHDGAGRPLTDHRSEQRADGSCL